MNENFNIFNSLSLYFGYTETLTKQQIMALKPHMPSVPEPYSGILWQNVITNISIGMGNISAGELKISLGGKSFGALG
jgi:hypothetical protein